MELVSVLEVVVHTEELEQDTIAEAANTEADDLKVYTRVRLAFCSKETFLTLFESLIILNTSATHIILQHIKNTNIKNTNIITKNFKL